MNVSYQYANRNNTSVLLKFEGLVGNQTMCLLIDAGDGVDVDQLIDKDKNEYLTGVLLTHLHQDHYSSLDENLIDGAKIYTSEENEKILNTVLSEANTHNNTEIDTETVESSVEPISTSTTIGGDLTITPVPAGHAPGATAFYLEFPGTNGTETILVTGDFTRRKVAGYPGLPLHHTDTLILTGATSDTFCDSMSNAVDDALQQGVSGSPTLITASGLNSVHIAYLLGHAIERTSQPLQVDIVGQAAKLYDALEYNVPHVTSIQEYNADEVVDEGHITISGPDIPNGGGSKLLFDEIREDPNAGLIQLTSSNRSEIAESRCTVNRYEAVNHPTMGTIEDTIHLLDPKQVVVTHQTGNDLHRYRDQFSTIVWAPKSNGEFTIYENGEYSPPHWVSETIVDKYSHREQEFRLPEVDQAAVSFKRTDADLESEGLNLDNITLTADREETDSKYSTSQRPPSSQQEEDISATGTAIDMEERVRADGATVHSTTDGSPTPKDTEVDVTKALSRIEATLNDIDERLPKETGIEASVVHVDNGTLVLEVDGNESLPEVGESVTIR